jgi:hypothetical protein
MRQNRMELGFIKTVAPGGENHFYLFAGQRTVNKHYLAIAMSNAPAFLAEFLNFQGKGFCRQLSGAATTFHGDRVFNPR